MEDDEQIIKFLDEMYDKFVKISEKVIKDYIESLDLYDYFMLQNAVISRPGMPVEINNLLNYTQNIFYLMDSFSEGKLSNKFLKNRELNQNLWAWLDNESHETIKYYRSATSQLHEKFCDEVEKDFGKELVNYVCENKEELYQDMAAGNEIKLSPNKLSQETQNKLILSEALLEVFLPLDELLTPKAKQ